MPKIESSIDSLPQGWEFPERNWAKPVDLVWNPAIRYVKGSTPDYDFEYILSEWGRPKEMRRKVGNAIDVIVNRPDPENPYNVCYTFTKDSGNDTGLTVRFIRPFQFHPLPSTPTFGHATYHPTGFLQSMSTGELFSPSHENPVPKMVSYREIIDGKPQNFNPSQETRLGYHWTYWGDGSNYRLDDQEIATKIVKRITLPSPILYSGALIRAYDDTHFDDGTPLWTKIPSMIPVDLSFRALSFSILENTDVKAKGATIVIPNLLPAPAPFIEADQVVGPVGIADIFLAQELTQSRTDD